MRKDNKEIFRNLRSRLALNCDVEMKMFVSDDVYIDFVNDVSISIYDIDDYYKEYINDDTDLSFEDYLLQECIKYVEGKRDLPTA